MAINDLGSAEMNAHLLEFDSVHGRFPGKIAVANGHLKADGQDVAVLSEATPEKLPWRDLGVDIVMECTGRFTDRDGAAKHLTAGAKRVLVSAPCTGADLTVVYRRQPRQAHAGASRRLQRFLHHQLPRTGGAGAERGDRHQARLHDHGARLYRRPAHGGHAAQGPVSGPRQRRESDPDLDRRRQGRGPGAAGAEGQARRRRRSACRCRM